MRKLYILLIVTLMIFLSKDLCAQISPCSITGAVVTIPYPASNIILNASVNGMSQYNYLWNDGSAIGTTSQKPFYTGWCVTITDIITGCDTTICESCIPSGNFGMCTMIYMPVCGCDGNIYSNDCVAMTNGIFTFVSAIDTMTGQLLPCNTSTASWDCDGQGNCLDPGTGNGQYSSLSQCQSSCIVSSWDCDGQGNCLDLGLGMGQYLSKADCDSVCIISLLNEENLEIKIYPNPTKNILLVNGAYLSATIYDIFGKVVININHQKNTIDMTSLKNGVYFIHLNNNNAVSVKKIILRN